MNKLHIGELLDDQVEYSLSELCDVANCRQEWIRRLVDEGIIEPRNDNNENLVFSASCLKKIYSAMRLEHDLGINIAGVALALELIDEIRHLRCKLDMRTKYQH